MKKLKRPLSILLSVLMVVSLFTVVPITASANELSSASSQEVSASDNKMIVAGSETEIFGSYWSGADENNLMTLNPDGTYTKTYTVEKAYEGVQLKAVLNDDKWYGDATGNNVTFNLTGEGTFTVTATPSGDDYVVSVSGDNVEFITGFEYNTVYAVGDGSGNWLNDASWNPGYAENAMTQVSPDVWEIEFTEVPKGSERQFKFAIDGDWTHNFGGTFVESGVPSAAVYNGSNITFGTDEGATVKLQLDLSGFDFSTKEGATFTVTITYPSEPEPTTEESTTEESTTEEPTTEESTTEEPATDAPATTEEPATDAPAPADKMLVAGSEADIFGTAWDGTNEANLMTANQDGTFTKTYTVTKAFEAVQLKAVLNGATWYGDATNNNVTFNLTGEGEFTVTATPDEELGYIVSVSGDIVAFITEFEYDTVYAVGNGEGNWLNGESWDPSYAANEMVEVAEDVWEIEFTEVPEGFDRQIKFALDGTWTHNFGGVFSESGAATAAVYNGDNITFDTEEDDATVKVQLDLSGFDFSTKEGATFTVTITYPSEPEPTTEEPTEEPTTEEPATEAPDPSDQEAADVVIATINALPAVPSIANKNAFVAAKNAYETLTMAQRNLVPQELSQQLYAALDTIADLEAAADVTALINNLPDVSTVTVEDKTDVEAARGAYDALTDAQKDYVSAETLQKLEDVEQRIADIEAANMIAALIEPLPTAENVTLADSQEINEAVNAYEGLTQAQRNLVPPALVEKLYADYDKVGDLQAAASVTDKINALPAADVITIADKSDVQAARADYETLTDAQKDLIDDAVLAKLVAVEKSINDQEEAKAATDLINDLPAEITLEDEADVQAARLAYDALTDDQKALVDDAVLAKLVAAEKKITDLKAANVIIGLINDLPAIEDITLADAEAVQFARNAYNGLTVDQWEIVGVAPLEKLCNAEYKLKAIPVCNMINDFPEELTYEDKADVEAAREAYDALIADEKEFVDEETYNKLLAAEKYIADYEDASDVAAMIQALPAVADITAADKDAVYAAKEAFDNLSDEAKDFIPLRLQVKLAAVLITVDAAVKAAEDKAAADAVTEMIRALPSATAITADAKDAVEQASAAYDALTDDQKALVPLASKLKLTVVKGALDAALKQAEDEAAAATVAEMIKALPAPADVTIDDKAAIDETKAAYDALTSDQKKLIVLGDRVKLAADVGVLAGIEDEIAADAVEALIEALPAASNVTIDDKAAIEEARAAYDALTDDQKKLVVLADRTKLNSVEAALAQIEADIAAAQSVVEMIEALPAAEDVTLDDADAVAEVREAYEALTEAQKDLITYETVAKLYDDEYALRQLAAVENVKEMIDALPAAEDMAYGDKPAVEEARAAYEALTDAQKAMVDEETVAKLVEAEETIVKIEDDIEAAGDVSVLIRDLPSAFVVTLDDKAVIDEAATAYDALTDAQKQYVPLADKVKLAAVRGVLAAIEKSIADQAAADEVAALIEALPAAEDVTLENSDAIYQAKDAYNALTEDQKLLVPAEDKIKLVGDVTALAKIENDIVKADSVTNLIESLPAAEELTYEDKADVEAAREAYDALYDDQKALVPAETVQKLEEAEAAMAVIAQVYDVEDAINALPAAEDITYDDKADVEAARAAYEALTDDQKIQIPDETLQKLIDAEAAIEAIEADMAAAAEVAEQINALPSAVKVTVNDKEAIDAASDAYEALTDAQKAFVPTAAKVKLAVVKGALGAAEKAAFDEAAADAVEEMIEALPATNDLTIDDKAAVEEARAAYDALTADQKRLVVLTDRIKLALAEAAIEKIEDDMAAAQEVTDMIEALPAAEEVVFEDVEAIADARLAYDDLTDDQKAYVADETLQKLVDDEAAIVSILQVLFCEDAINALPAAEDITYADKADVVDARGAYDALTDDQKIQIPDETLQKLIDAEAAIEKIEEDIEAAAAVEDLIDALPNPNRVTINDKEAIEEAQAAYDALTDEQKARVDEADKVKLAVDSAVLEKIEADIAAAAAVVELIDAIPAVEDITYADKDAIEAARAAFDDLTFFQKLRVGAENYNKLVEAENRLNSFVLLGDANEDGRITVLDITAIQRHIAEIQPLTDKGYKAADVNGDGEVTIEDATALQMYLAEVEVEYPIGEMV